ncbi:MAG TPA: MFS transporter [Rhodocyclaceae bacterium]
MSTSADAAAHAGSHALSPEERRAGIGLASIFALRMLGLFLVLPVFTLYAADIPGGTDPAMVGVALGAYGLTQALLQIPFGTLSDRFGRKRVIVIGLLIYAFGSIVCALAGSIEMLIAGRVLQGAGAISAAVTALAADLTRDASRTRVMAMIGSSIGLVFALSLVIAPPLAGAIGLTGIFWLTALLSLAGIVVLLRLVPAEPPRPSKPKRTRFAEVLADRDLLRLNIGVFALHLLQVALWVVVPSALFTAGLGKTEHWHVYLPALLLSFAVMVPAIIAAERRGKMPQIFRAAVVLLVVVQAGLLWAGEGVWALGLWITLFFVAFNVLEATLPSLISRMVPADAKGAALGVYNTTQSIGLFLGGAVGGLLAKGGGPAAVHGFGLAVAVLWLAVSVGMRFPVPRQGR